MAEAPQDSECNGSSVREEVEEVKDCNRIISYRIGGPDTSLPFFVESFLGWGLCFSCLAVSGYHYGKSVVFSSGWYFSIYPICRRVRGFVRGMMGRFGTSLIVSPPPSPAPLHNEADWIPLTTHSRAELDKHSSWERYLSLHHVLEKCHPEVLIEYDCSADAALIRVLRQNSICRRLTSLVMRPYNVDDHSTNPYGKSIHGHTTTTLLKQHPRNLLLQRISKMWKKLLVLPSLEEAKSYYHRPNSKATPVASARNKVHANAANYPYLISLILPAYNEKGSHLLCKLTKALERAKDPNEVEVVVVDAGGCSDLGMLLSLAGRNSNNNEDGSNHNYWGQVSIFSFTSGGGRGPCLNFGASVATGRILTFCHSDTTLPHHWDERIVLTLEHEGMNDDELSRKGIARANSCVFSFGIDTSHEGLSMPFLASTKSYYPPGIKAVQVTANLRNRLYSLPYGDQPLSMHACVFDFLGGFPDQCLMEDYELSSLLRRRAALFVPPSNSSGGKVKERVLVIPGTPSLCSPRRWQKFGVLYVTYMNSKFVNLYAGTRRMGPDELFQLYYCSKPPTRDACDSPWEVELAKRLES